MLGLRAWWESWKQIVKSHGQILEGSFLVALVPPLVGTWALQSVWEASFAKHHQEKGNCPSEKVGDRLKRIMRVYLKPFGALGTCPANVCAQGQAERYLRSFNFFGVYVFFCCFFDPKGMYGARGSRKVTPLISPWCFCSEVPAPSCCKPWLGEVG